MKFFTLILSFLLVMTSCSDFHKGSQINTLIKLNKTIDSIDSVLTENKIEDIEQIEIDAKAVKNRIKENIGSDTLDLKLGNKIDAYIRMYNSIKPIKKLFAGMTKNLRLQKIALIRLQKDIENGNGDRSRYDEFVRFENKKVNQISGLLKQYIQNRKNIIDTYLALHDKLYSYSFNLITE